MKAYLGKSLIIGFLCTSIAQTCDAWTAAGGSGRSLHAASANRPVTGLSGTNDSHADDGASSGLDTRRDALAGGMRLIFGAAVTTASLMPEPAQARYVLDDETGDYVEVEDVDWQTAWRQRADKAQSMNRDEIFAAARGAGNTNLKEGDESSASQKRRAMSGCRDAGVRERARAGTEKECVSRVFTGETAFVLDAL